MLLGGIWKVPSSCPAWTGHGRLVFLYWGPLVHRQLPGHSEAVVVEPEAVQLPEPGVALLVAHSVLIYKMSLKFLVVSLACTWPTDSRILESPNSLC